MWFEGSAPSSEEPKLAMFSKTLVPVFSTEILKIIEVAGSNTPPPATARCASANPENLERSLRVCPFFFAFASTHFELTHKLHAHCSCGDLWARQDSQRVRNAVQRELYQH